MALYGGAGGLELIETIIKEAHEHLTDTGQLWLEHEPEQVEKIHTLATENGFTPETHNDQYNLARYTVLTVAQ